MKKEITSINQLKKEFFPNMYKKEKEKKMSPKQRGEKLAKKILNL